MIEVVVVALAVVGLFFSLSGSIGVARMPDLYTRIQYSTKNVTLGMIPALLALVVGEGLFTSYARHALIVAFLVLVMSPASSHALARAARKTGIAQWRGARRDLDLRASSGHDPNGDATGSPQDADAAG